MFVKLLLLLFLYSFSTPAFSAGVANLTSNFTDGLLPQGLWVTAYSYSQSTAVSERYMSSGDRAPSVNSFTKSLTAFDLSRNAGSQFDKGLSLAAFQSYGIKPTDTAAIVSNDVEVNYQANTFVLGRGISPYLSLFFIAPSIKMNIQMESRLEYSANVKSMIQSLKDQGQHSRAEEIERKSKQLLKEQAEKFHYDDEVLTDWEGVPHFIISSRYTSPSLKKLGLSLETQFIIPNEKDNYPSQLIPVNFLEEAPSLLQAAYYKVYGQNNFDWNLYTHYQFRSAFNKSARLPQEDRFGSRTVNMRVKYGNEWQVGTQASYVIDKTYRLFTNVAYRTKEKDNYAYEGSEVSALEAGTQQSLTTAGVGLQLDFVDRFLTRRFPIPLLLTAQYSQSLAGKNAFANDVYSLNAMVFVK